MKDTLGVLLAGGAGERLFPLTRDRAKPAVTFGGIYRIIDVTLSNCINSDLRRVYILTQYKALSLNRHIREGWNIVASELGEFIEVLPPMKRASDQWYQGTADGVYQNIYSIGSEQPRHVLILSGDHIYKMNYDLMLRQHIDSAADVTIATIQIEPEETYRFGVMSVDSDNRVTGFEEKPTNTKIRVPGNPDRVPASMGVYLFNTDVLIPVLLKDAEDEHSSHDFGKDILPKMIDDYRVYGFDFVDENKKEALYWRDVVTLEAYTKPTWTWFRFRRFSICTTPRGRFVPISDNTLRQNSSLRNRAAPGRLWIRSFPRAALFPAAPCATACSRPTCA